MSKKVEEVVGVKKSITRKFWTGDEVLATEAVFMLGQSIIYYDAYLRHPASQEQKDKLNDDKISTQIELEKASELVKNDKMAMYQLPKNLHIKI